jgi:hypothetical protein
MTLQQPHAEWALAFERELQLASPLDQELLHLSLQRWTLAAQENVSVQDDSFLEQTGGCDDAEAAEYELESLSELLGDARCQITRDTAGRPVSVRVDCCHCIALDVAFPESGYPSTRLPVPTVRCDSLLTWRECRAVEHRLMLAELSDDARGETGCVLRWVSAVERFVERTLNEETS